VSNILELREGGGFIGGNVPKNKHLWKQYDGKAEKRGGKRTTPRKAKGGELPVIATTRDGRMG